MNLTRKVLKYLWPYRNGFALAVAQVFLISACELLKPWPLQIIIDNILSGKPFDWHALSGWPPELLLLVACLGLVLIYLALAVLSLLNKLVTITIGQKMVNDFRSDLYHHLQRLSLSFHHRRQVGDMLYRITEDTYTIQTLTMNGFFPIFTSAIFLVGMFVVMIKMDVLLTLLSLAICPLLFVAIRILTQRITDSARTARQQESKTFSVAQQLVSAIRVVQSFGKEKEEHGRFLDASTESMKANLKLYTWETLYGGIVNVLIAIGTAGVIWVGASHVLSGQLSIGQLTVFTAYLASLYTPINSMSYTYGLIQHAKVGVRRVFEILETEHELTDGPKVFPPQGCRGEVRFLNVSFRYAEGRPILRDIDLKVEPGETVAIVGATGAGKSSLVNLITRFYDPVEGQVLIDGVDVRQYRLPSLRRQIAMVLQPPLVFPVTLKENIAYGNSQASDEEIIAAAKTARIHDFILRLPQGYDTLASEQGTTLSDGEKQRLTLARAILCRAPILILDEPTSSVDADTERSIMKELKKGSAGRTTFLIAHRLSTVREATRILMLQDGKIIEEGTFDQLLERRGAFAVLYRAQFSAHEEAQIAVP